MGINPIEIIKNPLSQTGPGPFIRLVLAESAAFGMDGRTIALLDDMAAMLGFYQPIPAGQASHLAGPLVNWRTHPDQPLFERVRDVESLAYKQRALIAFGGAPPGQTVGTAEIVIACGNLAQGTCPPEYYEIFTWAALDTLAILTGATKAEILRDPSKKHWHSIDDAEVLRPSGRLYQTYCEVATSIRREAIAALDRDPTNPRKYLRPVAAHFIESHTKVRHEAAAKGLSGVVERLDAAIKLIKSMYPDLGSLEHEFSGSDVERDVD